MGVLIENIEDFELKIGDMGETDVEMFGVFPSYMYDIDNQLELKQALLEEFNNTPLDELNSQRGMDIAKKFINPKYHNQIIGSVFAPTKHISWKTYRLMVYRRYADKIDIFWCFKFSVNEEHVEEVFDIAADNAAEDCKNVGWKLKKVDKIRIRYQRA